MRENKGFTLLEILIAIAVIGIISGGFYLRSARQAREHTEEKACFHNRSVIARAESRYYFDRETPSSNFRDLYDSGYISVIPECPSGGVYAWLPPEETGGVLQSQVVCSVHGIIEEENGNGGEEAPELPDHPEWDPQTAYSGGSYIIFESGVYRARYWTRGDEPGKLASPWQEVTDQWRDFNIYHGGDMVFYDGVEYRAKWWNQNARPDISSAWELAD